MISMYFSLKAFAVEISFLSFLAKFWWKALR